MEQEKMKGNKSIALFMGVLDGVITHNLDMYCKDMVYHERWDALMPVVEKIEQLGFVTKINTHYTTISRYNPIAQIFINHTESKNKIEMVYLAVVDFIQYYNQTQIKENGK